MTEEYLKGDERVYQEGFADLDLAMIPKLKIINLAFRIETLLKTY